MSQQSTPWLIDFPCANELLTANEEKHMIPLNNAEFLIQVKRYGYFFFVSTESGTQHSSLAKLKV